MKGRDKRRRAQKLRERAEDGKSTKGLRATVATEDLPLNVNTAAPDLTKVVCNGCFTAGGIKKVPTGECWCERCGQVYSRAKSA